MDASSSVFEAQREGDLVLPEPPSGLRVLNDAEAATELAALATAGKTVLVHSNDYTCCFYAVPAVGDPVAVFCGEFGEAALEAAKALLSRKRLRWREVAGAPWSVTPSAADSSVATTRSVKQWLKGAEEATGREGDLNTAGQNELSYLAAWRCQFAGCGCDLRQHAATGKVGKLSYFAHIVAASPKGPRGHPTQSAALASDVSNVMLLCDGCHRLIDKINPAKYTVGVLRQMREDSIAQVKRLLDTLQHKPAEVIAVIGNIGAQSPHLDMSEVHEALWTSGLRTVDAKPTYLFSNGGFQHDVHSEAYWQSMFAVMKRDAAVLQGRLDGSTEGGTPRARLAVFPMHSTSVLILAGRVLGDPSGTHLFQPHRNKVSGTSRWAWTEDVPRVEEKFQLQQLRPHAGEEEAVLVVALTSDVAASRMPAGCADNGELKLPTLRITGAAFDKDCIQHPDDLRELAGVIDKAIHCLQDEWRVKKAHLFVCAPTTATVLVGQKMQARHHADYVCHEARGGLDSPFAPTIEISHTRVRELISGRANSFTLKP